jgi:hypothetical protein
MEFAAAALESVIEIQVLGKDESYNLCCISIFYRETYPIVKGQTSVFPKPSNINESAIK